MINNCWPSRLQVTWGNFQIIRGHFSLEVDLTYLFAWPPYEALDGIKALDSGANDLIYEDDQGSK